MDEETIQSFCDITLCDRRTAIYCLQRHVNNLQLALSYYFDNSSRLVIPPDFMTETQETQNNHQDHQENQSNPVQPENRPPPPTVSYTRVLRNINATSKPVPSLYLPFGIQQFQSPVSSDDLFQNKQKQNPLDPVQLFPALESKHIMCTVWKDGITWESTFYSKKDPNCKKALKQIKHNQLPIALFPDLNDSEKLYDIEISFSSKKYEDSK